MSSAIECLLGTNANRPQMAQAQAGSSVVSSSKRLAAKSNEVMSADSWERSIEWKNEIREIFYTDNNDKRSYNN